ncbi:fimbrillin family protein [Bacteroides fragilis]|nr:fimbrillin family protein [Bacteroides fragilis]MCE8767312.1 fimbrillin family protein [Bacteroides fragilis]
MKNVFILLLLGTASLFCIACSGENSVLTDGDAVLLQPGVHAGATLASTRSMINDVGTGADRISTIGIYLAAADGSLYPGSNAGGATFTKAASGTNWTSTPSTYVSLAKATVYAWAPAATALKSDGGSGSGGNSGSGSGGSSSTVLPALPVSVPAGQTFDGGNTYDCSTTDYLYGSGSATVGSATAVTANSLSPSPTLYLQHALSQVVFRIQNANDRTPDPTYDYVRQIKLTAAGGATPFYCTTASGSGSAGTMSLTDGALSGLDEVGEISFTPSAHPQQVGTSGPVTVAYGLVAPKAGAASGTQVTLTLTLGEQSSDVTERDLTLSTDAFNPAWQKGYRYVYTLTLGERGISLQPVDIKGWAEVSGGSSDVDPGWQ